MKISRLFRSSAIAAAVVLSLPACADEWPDSSISKTPPKGLEMIAVPAGCYTMGDVAGVGDADEKPAHGVCVKGYSIGEYLVTQGQWVAIMGHNPSVYPQCGGDCPVENVSWADVQEFIHRLNLRTKKTYRLPTEAEWEYAARGGKDSGASDRWAGTGDEKDLIDFAWYVANSTFQTHPVGLKKPNALGLYDMTGNVWEWTADWYAPDYYAKSPKNDPAGPASGAKRVLRGGYWGDLDRFARLTHRIGLGPQVQAGGGYGFRLALSSTPQ